MKTLLVVVLLILAALVGMGVGVYELPILQKAGVLGPGATVTDPAGEKPDAAREVTAVGRLEPESRILEVNAPTGSRIERLGDKVEEGATVAKGEPLAYLDSYAELLAARDLAQAQLDEAQQRLNAETRVGQAAISAAKLKIRQAQEIIPKQIKAQEAEVRRSQAELDKCRLDVQRSAMMLSDRAIPQSQHDAATLLLRQCEEQLDRNQATLEHLKSQRALKLEMGQADLESAEAGQVRAELSAQVQSLTSAVGLARARLDRAVIHAPIAGEIIKVLTRAGESVGRDPILKMGNTQSMYAIAEVYETDVRLVLPGQKAAITSKAFPAETITGVVERVGSLIYKNDVLHLDPTKDADSRVIEVRIRLDDSRLAAKYNYLQVDIRISRDGA